MQEGDIFFTLIEVRLPNVDPLQFRCPHYWKASKIASFVMEHYPKLQVPLNKEARLFYAGRSVDPQETLQVTLLNVKTPLPVFLLTFSAPTLEQQQQHQYARESIKHLLYKQLHTNIGALSADSQFAGNFNPLLQYYPVMAVNLNEKTLLYKTLSSRIDSRQQELIRIIQQNTDTPDTEQTKDDLEFHLKLLFQIGVFFWIFQPYFKDLYFYVLLLVMAIYYKIRLNDYRMQQRIQLERTQRNQQQRQQLLLAQQPPAVVDKLAPLIQHEVEQKQQIVIDKSISLMQEELTTTVSAEDVLQLQHQNQQLQQQHQQMQHQQLQLQQQQQTLQQQQQTLQQQQQQLQQLQPQQEQQPQPIQLEQGEQFVAHPAPPVAPPQRSLRTVFASTVEFTYCFFISLFPTWYVELYVQQNPQEPLPVQVEQELVVQDVVQQVVQEVMQEHFVQEHVEQEHFVQEHVEQGVEQDQKDYFYNNDNDNNNDNNDDNNQDNNFDNQFNDND